MAPNTHDYSFGNYRSHSRTRLTHNMISDYIQPQNANGLDQNTIESLLGGNDMSKLKICPCYDNLVIID